MYPLHYLNKEMSPCSELAAAAATNVAPWRGVKSILLALVTCAHIHTNKQTAGA